MDEPRELSLQSVPLHVNRKGAFMPYGLLQSATKHHSANDDFHVQRGKLPHSTVTGDH